jgi:hypothetical protein
LRKFVVKILKILSKINPYGKNFHIRKPFLDNRRDSLYQGKRRQKALGKNWALTLCELAQVPEHFKKDKQYASSAC